MMEHVKFTIAGLMFIFIVLFLVVLICLYDLILYIVAGIVLIMLGWYIGLVLFDNKQK